MTENRLHPDFNPGRRLLLQRALAGSGMLVAGAGLWGGAAIGNSHQPGNPHKRLSNIPKLAGTLHEVTVENDPSTRMLIPRGFSVRQVARTGRIPVAGASYRWHGQPDGGATFATDEGGWIYVSNSEMKARHQGGAGALRFNAAGVLVDSYPVCTGTTNNCAGGPTPWGTWLSCEEIKLGLVYECYPLGGSPAVPIPALGAFTHEAVAVDPENRMLYLTEDKPDGNLYRFIPSSYPVDGRADLRTGDLQAAVVVGDDPFATRQVSWVNIPYPVPRLSGKPDRITPPTRKQVLNAEKFNGGEGCWYHQGLVYFSTKGDNRIWALDTRRNLLDLVYDKGRDQIFNPGIADVDNLTVSAAGDILVAEDGAEMRLVVVGPGITPFELINVQGHRKSEITGPAFSPDASRLYFSSQSGPAGNNRDGRTYEMQGPFFI